MVGLVPSILPSRATIAMPWCTYQSTVQGSVQVVLPRYFRCSCTFSSRGVRRLDARQAGVRPDGCEDSGGCPGVRGRDVPGHGDGDPDPQAEGQRADGPPEARDPSHPSAAGCVRARDREGEDLADRGRPISEPAAAAHPDVQERRRTPQPDVRRVRRGRNRRDLTPPTIPPDPIVQRVYCNSIASAQVPARPRHRLGLGSSDTRRIGNIAASRVPSVES